MPDRHQLLRTGSVLAALTVIAVLLTLRTPADLLATAPAPAAAAAGGGTAGQAAAVVIVQSAKSTPAEIAKNPTVEVRLDGLTVRASRHALADIPSDYLAYYLRTAQAMRKGCKALTWQLLAAIGKVETDHGRTPLPGVTSGLNSFGCCAGPMQFNLVNGPPSTWDSLKRPGDDVYDPADAIPAAARKLCHDGLGPDPFAKTWRGKHGGDPCPHVRGNAAEHRALRRYNNACWYAQQVLVMADRYTSDIPNPETAGPRDPFITALTKNKRITTTTARGCDPNPDLASGQLDLRIQAVLVALAEQNPIRISCAKTGHSRYVKGTTRVSNHTVWRGVDIDIVAGQPVSATNRAAHELVAWLGKLTGPLRPAEVGSPFAQYAPAPMFFTDAGHLGHIHIGYGP